MGIQINGQTDTISATDGSFTISGASGNLTGNLTGNVTGDVTGNLTGTASTATAAATAYGLSGSPTLSGITSVSTTNLTVNGTAYPTAGPLSNRNIIINGAMQVYQRSGTSTNIVGYHLDRWEMDANGGSRDTTQESLTSGDPYNEGFRSFHRLTNTTGSSITSAYRLITQKIEAQNIANSGWNYTSSTSYVTLSFWVRASIAQTYYIRVKSSDGTHQGYGSAFALSADTWTKVTKTIPGNSNITINNDNGVGLEVAFVPYFNTDYTDSGYTTDTWNTYSSSNQLPDMTTTWGTTNGATFDLTGVQLEVGTVATPFEHRSYGDELLRCQRYCETLEKNENETLIGIGLAYTTTRLLVAHTFKVAKRSSPSLSFVGSSNNVQMLQKGGGWTNSSSVVGTTGRSMCRIDCICGSAIYAAGEAGEIRVESTTKLIFSCEL